MKLTAVVCALSLLIVGVALNPSTAHGAQWISAAETYAASWVKDMEKELLKKEYSMIYANDPRTPQNEVLRLLNRAAKAQEANDPALAQQLVREALGVFEEGVRRHYYTQSDIEPITTYIKQHLPIKMS
ncbi:MAG TPA: hypothetical protein VFR79_11725 [Nitrospira sp.]|nr:hypothetical protein [Nitrospira sp.]